MKRSAPLRRRSRLRPVSAKGAARKAAARAQAKDEAGAFKAATSGLPCVECGRDEQEAWEETGHGHQAHHVVRQEVLKRLGLERHLWDPELAVAACEEPCHRRHTSRHARISWRKLPLRTLVRAGELGLGLELLKEHPA